MFFNHNNRYGWMHIGDKYVDLDSKMWTALAENVSPRGEIILFGCAGGQNLTFIQGVANATGITVRAVTYFTNFMANYTLNQTLTGAPGDKNYIKGFPWTIVKPEPKNP
jgi:hypothetical protein